MNQADILILKHQLRELLATLTAVSDDSVKMMRTLAAVLPLAEQPAALELAANHKAALDKQVTAARASIEAL